MRRRFIRRFNSRHGLSSAFRGPKARSDYREPSTGGSEGATSTFGDWESRLYLLVIIAGIVMVVHSVLWPHNALM
ncbi:hypothetical protein [Kordiimonas marina]|uniref:hypothetical protein n=1 Tax=Kordiimonas marina TaxID=2872312 RepID=UPI001FF60F8D|nr:hypothetical protein [Kordiimonas marina]MCJ9428782.1 hypothetical protein [Kordiimonas marina]